MLGTEYSWLISISKPFDGTPRVRLAGTGLLTIGVGVFCLLCATLKAEPLPRQLMKEAGVAAKAGDVATTIAKLEAVRALRPDYPRVLNNLARYYVQAGRGDEAMSQLRELAAMGLKVDLLKDADFAVLRERPDFAQLARAFAANEVAIGRDKTSWGVGEMTGIVEGIAIHPVTLESFFGDVHHRCIWYRDVSAGHAVARKFSSEGDALLGVFALKIDTKRNVLWASSSAVPEMKGYTAADRGKGFLAIYALASRRLEGKFPLPDDGREHVLGDFVIGADGAVYATDSVAPVIWRLAPDGKHLEKWLESDEFVSLQGIAVSETGRELYVSDYANGLWRIEVATRSARLLAAPAHTTLFGIDGIYSVPGGLVAVQNGINPQRVVRIELGAGGAPTGVKVLTAGDPEGNDLALGQVVNSHFDFIGNAGWALFEKGKEPAPARTVTILRTSLD